MLGVYEKMNNSLGRTPSALGAKNEFSEGGKTPPGIKEEKKMTAQRWLTQKRGGG